jgi:cytochrome c oxidase subunit 2
VLILVGALGSSPLAADAQPADVRVVRISAERFAFSPSQVRVKRGTRIEFRLRSEDTNHGFRIAKAGINVTIPKRGKGDLSVVFQTEEVGRFEFECSKPCGAGHTVMRGVIIVEE